MSWTVELGPESLPTPLLPFHISFPLLSRQGVPYLFLPRPLGAPPLRPRAHAAGSLR